MADMPYDRKAGKRRLVLRMGFRNSIYGLAIIHALLIANIAFAAYLFADGWVLLLAIVPYLLLLPGIFLLLAKGLNDRKKINGGARLNFFSFVVFSVMIMAGFTAIALT